ncbi:XTP/dITP diphosphatase [Candidatus Micrarchaeota archaeon]|nr:XTP/dITP diphosphatase [Candidatus Micrarchaeota archaeon]
MIELLFATGNKGKYIEAKEILEQQIPEVRIKQLDFKHIEIRSESIEEIAAEAVERAFEESRMPVFVEDSGLFIKTLNGFPGTYSSWVAKKIGNRGILKLLKGEKDRTAEFRAAISFRSQKNAKTIIGICKGEIAKTEKGNGGFGYDPIFVPKGHKTTFAQSIGLKNKLSHRYEALLEFSKYLKAHLRR